METLLSPHYQPPPPPAAAAAAGSNLHMLYYGLVVAGTAAVVLVLYNIIVVKFCSERILIDRQIGLHGRFTNSNWKYTTQYCDIPSFRYKKDQNQASPRDGSCTDQCVVCLSTFEEGEELRKLPKCRHSFHASCIDMWLYSHMDCPVCRTEVFERRAADVDRPGHPRGEVLGPLAMV